MPTVFTHPAPILALAAGLGGRVIPWRLALAGVVCAVLPDLDVIGFKFGVGYAQALGHRGFSHSLVLALAVGCAGALLAPWLRCRRLTAFLVTAGAVASHILLDAMTNGGPGVAVFWPFNETRFFLPWRPIRVSPLSLRVFFSGRGLAVLHSEALWVWLPCLIAAVTLRAGRTRFPLGSA